MYGRGRVVYTSWSCLPSWLESRPSGTSIGLTIPLLGFTRAKRAMSTESWCKKFAPSSNPDSVYIHILEMGVMFNNSLHRIYTGWNK